MGTDEDRAAMAERSRLRRERMVAHRASGHAHAEAWDLEFWQAQSPEERLSALVAIRRDGRGRTEGRSPLTWTRSRTSRTSWSCSIATAFAT